MAPRHLRPSGPLIGGLLTTALAIGSFSSPCVAQENPGKASRPPNIVVIFVDDMGYADIGPFGGKVPTPNLDRMAKEGMRLTDFVVSSAVCSASRAALLTGCYHRRVGINGALGPDAQIGISEKEMTIAQLCKQKGYATACFGKWHLGHHPKFLPLQHGFDEYFGLPYSNDMWPLHPAYAHLPADSVKRKQGYPNLPLIEGNQIVDAEVTGEDQEQLTTWYTERAVAFVEKNKDQPFFLYLPHSMVHVPLFVSEKFRGKSKQGLFGDVVMEIDWSVGQVLDTVRRLGLDDNTLVLFTSDNGPWLSYGNHAGSAGPFREGKGTMFEGGVREPTIARWPGRIPAGSECHELASTIDVLPTIAKLIGAELPKHKIDGLDISPLLFGEAGAVSPHEVFACYYAGGQLQAVRNAQWKLHFPHTYASLEGKPGGLDGSPGSYTNKQIGRELYDLRADPGETKNVAAEHPEIVAHLEKLAQALREDLGDTLTKTKGTGARPHGTMTPEDARLR
ncbi:MAG: sulfatase [Planctomycetes bacterium]|jgi:arylsulfatase A|nr:sulfatase [Planctomycetota bacterium]